MILLSQVVQPEGSVWLTVFTSIANMGFAALVGWYLLTKALPKMQEQYNLYQQESKEQFLTDIKLARAEFLSEIKESRNYSETREVRSQTEAKAALQAVIQHCEKESTRRDESLKMELSLVASSMKGQQEVLEEVRDALRDMKSALKVLCPIPNSNPSHK